MRQGFLLFIWVSILFPCNPDIFHITECQETSIFCLNTIFIQPKEILVSAINFLKMSC